MKEILDIKVKLRPYLIRKNFELLALVIMVLSALVVFATGRRTNGTLTYEDVGMSYSGQIVRNRLNGEGTLTYSNGDTYTGDFTDSLFSGEGMFESTSGWSYKGKFKNGLADGQGVLTTQSGAVYQGEFKEGVYQSEN